eukprot:3588429-Rhodomonas_salina.2
MRASVRLGLGPGTGPGVTVAATQLEPERMVGAVDANSGRDGCLLLQSQCLGVRRHHGEEVVDVAWASLRVQWRVRHATAVLPQQHLEVPGLGGLFLRRARDLLLQVLGELLPSLRAHQRHAPHLRLRLAARAELQPALFSVPLDLRAPPGARAFSVCLAPHRQQH